MSDEYSDPSGNTEQFRAFVRAPQDRPAGSRTPLIVGGAVLVLLAALVVYLLVR